MKVRDLRPTRMNKRVREHWDPIEKLEGWDKQLNAPRAAWRAYDLLDFSTFNDHIENFSYLKP